MIRPSADPVADSFAHSRTAGGSPAPVPSLAAAARTAFDGVGFALLCLLTASAPSALRRQLDGGWDAGFAPQQTA